MNTHLITYQNKRIILSHERKDKVTKDIYPIQHLLTYITEGELRINHNGEERSYGKGTFVLFKRFSQATITKTWGNGGTKFSSIVFSFQEELVREALHQLHVKPYNKITHETGNVIGINPNPVLKQFIESLKIFFDDGMEIDEQLARLKTIEALVGLMKSDETLIIQLEDYSKESKADLHQYMNFHYLENKRLEDFARESGRSLSTFKKDFQSIYNQPPAKWLKEKRLDYAYHLLTTTGRKASEVYMECGFEDLAHFSKSFKIRYNINPSKAVTKQTSK